MEGCVVEAHGVSCSGMRGVIVGVRNKKRDVMRHDGTIQVLKVHNLCPVFCVGLPRECRGKIRVQKEDAGNVRTICEQVLGHGVDATKFHILMLGEDAEREWWHFAKVPLGLWRRAVQAVAAKDREPLMRFYVCDYSQNDADGKLRFGNDMRDASADAPCFADVDSAYALAVASGFQSAPVDASAQNLELEVARLASLGEANR